MGSQVNLSRRQKCILEFIREFIRDRAYPPTIREIQFGCNVSSTSVVDYNLHAMEKAGVLRRSREVSRAIELLDTNGRRVIAGRNTRTIPILGFVAAGTPLPVFPETSTLTDVETLEVATSLLPPGSEVYALKVRGTSMIDALVDDGDTILLTPAPQAVDGQMVVVWFKKENEATLKRLYREGNLVRLQPANPKMQPIWVDAQDIEIQGQVIGVVRSLS
ncbi:MAG: repressor LexA [SAR202 cluster bacterium]|nr:repressor LexA [SAR202 cluster bacterium]|tara:strand:- start:378 stop:1034 length:657 start_codon:yes stop_codon:yes gene_type:complete